MVSEKNTPSPSHLLFHFGLSQTSYFCLVHFPWKLEMILEKECWLFCCYMLILFCNFLQFCKMQIWTGWVEFCMLIWFFQGFLCSCADIHENWNPRQLKNPPSARNYQCWCEWVKCLRWRSIILQLNLFSKFLFLAPQLNTRYGLHSGYQ